MNEVLYVRRKPIDTLDGQVRQGLARWPQRPPGLEPSPKQPGTWLRGRPDPAPVAKPFLKFAGTSVHRTLPDGLWLHFGPSPRDPYVDILCIEACSSVANLLDKRSRFAPSTGSMLAHCPLGWLLAPCIDDDPTPRWRLIGVLRTAPTGPLELPVRDMRVLFGLPPRRYREFVATQTAHAHEFYCPMSVLADAAAPENPALRALMARAAAAANFMELPA
ncbi:MAG: hypothetical protein K2X11_09015 [Acetobacteraceae bacterium]|nr:hypothetical protein [Acetobacteraceae bacterium]